MCVLRAWACVSVDWTERERRLVETNIQRVTKHSICVTRSHRTDLHRYTPAFFKVSSHCRHAAKRLAHCATGWLSTPNVSDYKHPPNQKYSHQYPVEPLWADILQVFKAQSRWQESNMGKEMRGETCRDYSSTGLNSPSTWRLSY